MRCEAKFDRLSVEVIYEDGEYQRAATRGDGTAGDELTDLTIVFTGSIENWTRDELEELVERHGGDATDSVSGNTDYLVAGENPGGTKQDDAESNDFSELDPDEFFDLLAHRGVDIERENSSRFQSQIHLLLSLNRRRSIGQCTISSGSPFDVIRGRASDIETRLLTRRLR